MPCDSIIQNTVVFQEGEKQLDMLEEALREQGYSVTREGNTLSFYGKGHSGTYADGKFDVESSAYGRSFDVDAVKRSFSKACVKKAARSYGWTVVDKGNNKFEIRKRA